MRTLAVQTKTLFLVSGEVQRRCQYELVQRNKYRRGRTVRSQGPGRAAVHGPARTTYSIGSPPRGPIFRRSPSMAPSEGMLPIHSAQPEEPISKSEYRQTVRSHSRRRLRRLIKAQADYGGRQSRPAPARLAPAWFWNSRGRLIESATGTPLCSKPSTEPVVPGFLEVEDHDGV